MVDEREAAAGRAPPEEAVGPPGAAADELEALSDLLGVPEKSPGQGERPLGRPQALARA